MQENHFDFIICGAGCAGLSLASRLTEKEFSNKKVLLIDKDNKKTNDRTWSFWTKEGDNRYKSIYKKSWDNLTFHNPSIHVTSNPHPYSYHTISGIDFYQYNLELINQADHISFSQEDILSISDRGNDVYVTTNKGSYTADYVFDSLVRSFPEESNLFVWQHFLGWEIELLEGSFDDSTATFMDFRIEQGDETRFVYVLPFDKKNALVEATLFSKDVWEESSYEEILRPYIDQYVGSKYVIKKKEIGKIPMTTTPFSKGSKRVIPIGTNNSTVKPSSGYAFTRIQREAEEIVKSIERNKIGRIKTKPKYLSYDRTLLNVLLTEKDTASHVFGLMFQRNSFGTNLKFLDEATSIFEEIRIFMTLPFWPFLKAFLQENVLTRTKS